MGANIFIFKDKIRVFVYKMNLWINKIANENYSLNNNKKKTEIGRSDDMRISSEQILEFQNS